MICPLRFLPLSISYRKDLYGLSNEITGETGEIYVHRGSVLTVQTND